MKSIVILGSTGSIGVNVLNIVRAHPGRYRVLGLAAGRNVDLTEAQAREFSPRIVSLSMEKDARELSDRLGKDAPRIVHGEAGIREVATAAGADLVVSAVVGAAGLPPTWAAIDAGIPVALANKETLVMAGALVIDLAAKRHVPLLPVDSEHSAIFQSLRGHDRREVRRIILTASGGPFRRRDPGTLGAVTREEALNHPTWKMGRKITIDSATLMNKGLEVIEARWLFGVPPEKIDVIIHPESIIHSMVEFQDGQIIAQLGMPDMKGPIGYALSYPERLPDVMPKLDLTSIGRLNFHAVDRQAFPCLDLAFEALRRGRDAPAVLNGANEAVVEAFLDGRIGFMDIPRIVSAVMETESGSELSNLEDVLDADVRARRASENLIASMKKMSEGKSDE
jgi:1-deoxy-D-xylulose-5-phosphate reductoisomerase